LFLSPSTVRKHIENIYNKLQVHNKLEAIQKARNNNLI
jgi:DNA-binding NarL/FixJ family response regulator